MSNFLFARDCGEFGSVTYDISVADMSDSQSSFSGVVNSINGVSFVEGTDDLQRVMSENFTEELKSNQDLYSDVLETFQALC